MAGHTGAKRYRGVSEDEGDDPNVWENTTKRPRWNRGDHRLWSKHAKFRDFQGLSHEDYSVGWVCALHNELAAAKAMLDEVHANLPTSPDDSNLYVFGRIGSHNVVIAFLPTGGYGTNNAAIVAGNLHRSFPDIRIRLMVGIGGGAPGQADLRLGDVVVSNHVVQYDLGKTIQDGRFQRTTNRQRPPHDIMMAVARLRADHEIQPSAIPTILSEMLERYPYMAKYRSPGPLHDRLFDGDYDHVDSAPTCDHCDQSRLVQRPVRSHNDPEIHYSGVASGNQVMKHGKTRDELAKTLEILCFEMEAAGLMNEHPFLVVRGICDYADSHKNKRWQEYAAATAAAYAKELLSVIARSVVQRVPRDGTPLDIPETRRWEGTAEAELALTLFLAEEFRRKHRKKLMKLLSFDQIDARRSTIKPALSKTCQWLYQNSVYQSWIDPGKASLHHGFLWINGKPGAGKSTLMKFAYTEAKRRAARHELCISFFFNARGDSLERSTTGMHRSLLLQLLEAFPDLQEVLDLAPESKEEQPVWTVELLCETFSAAIKGLGERQVTCYIDALDECDEEQVREMVFYFEELAAGAIETGIKLSICFSSRHYPSIDIKTGLKLTLENQRGHGEDLEQYVLSRLRAGSGKAIDEVRLQILEKANGVFLWVILVVDMLNVAFLEGRIWAVQRRLQEIPAKLSDLFKQILTRDRKNSEELLLCIQLILFAERPLRREEFYFGLVAGLAPNLDDFKWDPKRITTDDMDRYVLSASKGLAQLTKSFSPTVQFIHESVKDFLLKDKGMQELWPDLGDEEQMRCLGHNQLKKCCQAYLAVDISDHVRTMMAVIAVEKAAPHLSRLSHEDGVQTLRTVVSTVFPFLKYAAMHVLSHAEQAAASIPQDDFVLNFHSSTWISQINIFADERNLQTVPLLYILAKEGFVKLITTALRHDPKTEIRGGRYYYPLFAALRFHRYAAARAIIEVNQSVPSEDPTTNLQFGAKFQPNETPLLWAIENGHVAVVRLLLKQSPDIEAQDREGRTPLLLAVECGYDSILTLLVEHGANIEAQMGREGRTAVSIAAAKGQRVHEAIAKFLLERGAKADPPSHLGRTPLWFAVWGGHVPMVKLLLEKGADPEAHDWRGRTPLSLAASRGHDAIVKLLLKHEAQCDSRDRAGRTPLSWAARKGHEAVVKLLIGQGADLEVSDKRSQTPFTAAESAGRTAIVQLLEATKKERASSPREARNRCRKSATTLDVPGPNLVGESTVTASLEPC